MMKSPLIIEIDLYQLIDDQHALLKNSHLLACNQEPLYGARIPFQVGNKPGLAVKCDFPAKHWAVQFSNAKITMIAMLNTLNERVNKTAHFGEIPGMSKGKSFHLTDIWTGSSMGQFKDSYTASADSHDSAVVLAQPCNHGPHASI
jgi:hypothetical protein